MFRLKKNMLRLLYPFQGLKHVAQRWYLYFYGSVLVVQ